MVEKVKEFIKKIKLRDLVIIFFILQPIIDMYRTFFQDTINICGFAIEELINILFIGILFGLTIYKIVKKEKRAKSLVKYIVYLSIVGIYMILHWMNIAKFNNNIFEGAQINFITETYYIIRTYIIPIILIYIIYHCYLTNKDFTRIIVIVTLLISGSIFITNLLNVSLVAYSADNVRIEGNIFKWLSLNGDSNFAAYTSRGFFHSTNQISALLFSLAPIIIKEVIKNNKIRYYILLIIQLISMIMVGTKTASIGVILVLIAMIFVTLVLYFLKLERNINIKICIPIMLLITIGAYSLYMTSPSKLKYTLEKSEKEIIREDANITVKEANQEEKVNSLEDYIKLYAYNYYIQDWFLELYPVHNDEDFWNTIISRDKKLNIDNRNFKIDMIDRIIERNNNNMDSILGIGYTSNVPYTERDYVYQYYIFGIAGVFLLVGVYIGILVYCAYKILRNYKEKLNLENCSIGISLCCMLAAGYLSGHVWGMLINMYFMSLYTGMLLYNAKKEEKK
ncbi:MAG: O-antigen ligase family protein [Clostridia bacterium]|nr:O-antigen ligase family protein [Clostridia bacterium]